MTPSHGIVSEKRTAIMEATSKCGKQVTEHANISGSRFHDVNMAETEFDDMNMKGVSFHNINMSDIRVGAVQMGGAKFKHIGLPPGSAEKQRPLTFEEADLNSSTFLKCDLSNVRIDQCNIEGLTVNGVRISDLLAAGASRKV
jgi:uncharacterized protein YjbI with pentapeptide repeats